MDDHTPLLTIILFGVIAWLVLITIVLFDYLGLKEKLDDFFAQRRRDRRLRNYAKKKSSPTLKLYNKKGQAYASTRHRR